MTAYYNEVDPYAAAWLRNLIAAGHIADGVVDERSIEDVHPADLRGFAQCHFFAGIGVWSHALRLAGVADDRPVWTGSCPCQPFSAAGKGAGFADERHLWPAWHHLIREYRPQRVFGEQVASADSGPWIDLVQDDLEALGYAFGAVPFPAAGVGAPHIRDRLYFVADAQRAGVRRDEQRRLGGPAGSIRSEVREQRLRAHAGASGRVACLLADTEQPLRRCEAPAADHDGAQAGGPADRAGGRCGASVRLANSAQQRRREERADAGRCLEGDRAQGIAAGLVHGGLVGRVAHADGRLASDRDVQRGGQHGQQPQDGGAVLVGDADGAGLAAGSLSDDGGRAVRVQGAIAGTAEPVRGFWAGADWIACRDGKWRPVEPGTFPLAHGIAGRVGQLRAYGNAICAPAAAAFVRAAA